MATDAPDFNTPEVEVAAVPDFNAPTATAEPQAPPDFNQPTQPTVPQRNERAAAYGYSDAPAQADGGVPDFNAPQVADVPESSYVFSAYEDPAVFQQSQDSGDDGGFTLSPQAAQNWNAYDQSFVQNVAMDDYNTRLEQAVNAPDPRIMYDEPAGPQQPDRGIGGWFEDRGRDIGDTLGRIGDGVGKLAQGDLEGANQQAGEIQQRIRDTALGVPGAAWNAWTYPGDRLRQYGGALRDLSGADDLNPLDPLMGGTSIVQAGAGAGVELGEAFRRGGMDEVGQRLGHAWERGEQKGYSDNPLKDLGARAIMDPTNVLGSGVFSGAARAGQGGRVVQALAPLDEALDIPFRALSGRVGSGAVAGGMLGAMAGGIGVSTSDDLQKRIQALPPEWQMPATVAAPVAGLLIGAGLGRAGTGVVGRAIGGRGTGMIAANGGELVKPVNGVLQLAPDGAKAGIDGVRVAQPDEFYRVSTRLETMGGAGNAAEANRAAYNVQQVVRQATRDDVALNAGVLADIATFGAKETPDQIATRLGRIGVQADKPGLGIGADVLAVPENRRGLAYIAGALDAQTKGMTREDRIALFTKLQGDDPQMFWGTVLGLTQSHIQKQLGRGVADVRTLTGQLGMLGRELRFNPTADAAIAAKFKAMGDEGTKLAAVLKNYERTLGTISDALDPKDWGRAVSQTRRALKAAEEAVKALPDGAKPYAFDPALRKLNDNPFLSGATLSKQAMSSFLLTTPGYFVRNFLYTGPLTAVRTLIPNGDLRSLVPRLLEQDINLRLGDGAYARRDPYLRDAVTGELSNIRSVDGVFQQLGDFLGDRTAPIIRRPVQAALSAPGRFTIGAAAGFGFTDGDFGDRARNAAIVGGALGAGPAMRKFVPLLRDDYWRTVNWGSQTKAVYDRGFILEMASAYKMLPNVTDDEALFLAKRDLARKLSPNGKGGWFENGDIELLPSELRDRFINLAGRTTPDQFLTEVEKGLQQAANTAGVRLSFLPDLSPRGLLPEGMAEFRGTKFTQGPEPTGGLPTSPLDRQPSLAFSGQGNDLRANATQPRPSIGGVSNFMGVENAVQIPVGGVNNRLTGLIPDDVLNTAKQAQQGGYTRADREALSELLGRVRAAEGATEQEYLAHSVAVKAAAGESLTKLEEKILDGTFVPGVDQEPFKVYQNIIAILQAESGLTKAGDTRKFFNLAAVQNVIATGTPERVAAAERFLRAYQQFLDNYDVLRLPKGKAKTTPVVTVPKGSVQTPSDAAGMQAYLDAANQAAAQRRAAQSVSEADVRQGGVTDIIAARNMENPQAYQGTPATGPMASPRVGTPSAAGENWQLTKAEYDAALREGGWTDQGIALGDSRRWHENTILNALIDGKPVPERVLREYPGITERAAAARAERLATEQRAVQPSRPLNAEQQRQAIRDEQLARIAEQSRIDDAAKANRYLRTQADYLGKNSPRGNAGKLLLAEHRQAVEAALAEGKVVPPEVLRDYPDLAARAAQGGAGSPPGSAAALQSAAPIGALAGSQLDPDEERRRLWMGLGAAGIAGFGGYRLFRGINRAAPAVDDILRAAGDDIAAAAANPVPKPTLPPNVMSLSMARLTPIMDDLEQSTMKLNSLLMEASRSKVTVKSMAQEVTENVVNAAPRVGDNVPLKTYFAYPTPDGTWTVANMDTKTKISSGLSEFQARTEVEWNEAKPPRGKMPNKKAIELQDNVRLTMIDEGKDPFAGIARRNPNDPLLNPKVQAEIARREALAAELRAAQDEVLGEAAIPQDVARRIAAQMPDLSNPGWKTADGRPYFGTDVVRQGDGWVTPDGQSVTFTNSLARYFDPPTTSQFIEDYYAGMYNRVVQWFKSTQGGATGTAPTRMLDPKTVKEVQLRVADKANREGLQHSRHVMFGYDDRSVGQLALDMISPYSYFAMQALMQGTRFYAKHPGQYAVLLDGINRWEEETRHLPASMKWTVYAYTDADGNEVRFNPMALLAGPAGAGLQLITARPEVPGRAKDWIEELMDRSGLGGLNMPLEVARQGIGRATGLKGGLLPADPTENRYQTSQGRIITHLSAMGGTPIEPEGWLMEALSGNKRIGIDDYYAGLALQTMVRNGEVTEQQARAAILSNKEGKPDELWQRARVDGYRIQELPQGGLARFAGAPALVYGADRRASDETNAAYKKVLEGPDGLGGTSKDIRAFLEANPAQGVRSSLNDDPRQLRLAQATDAYYTERDAIEAKYQAILEDLSQQWQDGKITGKWWSDMRGNYYDQRKAELDTLKAKHPDADTDGTKFKALKETLDTEKKSNAWQPDPLTSFMRSVQPGGYKDPNEPLPVTPTRQAEAAQKALLSGYFDIRSDDPKYAKGDTVDYAAYKRDKDAYLAALTPEQRAYVLAETTKNQTEADRWYNAQIAPRMDQYFGMPEYTGGTPEQQARWKAADKVYGDASRKVYEANPTDGKTGDALNAIHAKAREAGQAALKAAGYTYDEYRIGQGYESQERKKAYASDDMRLLREFYGNSGPATYTAPKARYSDNPSPEEAVKRDNAQDLYYQNRDTMNARNREARVIAQFGRELWDTVKKTALRSDGTPSFGGAGGSNVPGSSSTGRGQTSQTSSSGANGRVSSSTSSRFTSTNTRRDSGMGRVNWDTDPVAKGIDGQPISVRTFWQEQELLRSRGQYNDAARQLNQNWDALLAAGVKLTGNKPTFRNDTQEAAYQERGRILEEYGRLKDRNAEQAARFYSQNADRLNELKAIIEGRPYTPPTIFQRSTSSGGRRGGGSIRVPRQPFTPRSTGIRAPATIHTDPEASALRAFFSGRQGIPAEAYLRRLRAKYPAGVPATASMQEWLDAVKGEILGLVAA